MTRQLLGIIGTLVGLAGASASAGGWAVITIKDLPDYAVAGVPLRLDLTIRQHGHSLVSGWESRVDARLGSRRVQATVRPLPEAGTYRAEMVLPEPGNWTVTAASGLFDAASFAMPVVASAAARPAATPAEVGARLFSAKGCVTCHRHEAAGSSKSIDAGPVLTRRQFAPEALAAKLFRPTPCVSGAPCMPNLDLSHSEIAALTAFLNAPPVERVVTRR